MLVGVPVGACGPAELKKFNDVLPDFQIKVFAATTTTELLFKGPEAKHIIYLSLDEKNQHYNVITGKYITQYFLKLQHWSTPVFNTFDLRNQSLTVNFSESNTFN